MNTAANSPAPPVHLRRILFVIVILVVLGLIAGFAPRWLARHKLYAEARTDLVPTVETVLPTAAKADLGTPLPADVQPYIEAAIHARASGYLKSWFVDIGELVTNGQSLAEIDTPELDEQLAQAKADLDEALAARDLSKITADRWTELLKTASVSDQETAEKQSDYVLKQAMVESSRANLQRLNDLKNFDRVTAPFDGVVTARNTDIGQLIASGSGPELFRLAQTNPLRVYVRVPQLLIHAIVPGQTARLTFQEMPGRDFAATVVRTAGAVDPTSRTLQVELQVPNPKGEILSGTYAQVRFNENVAAEVLTLSDNTLVFRSEGMQVAILDQDNKVRMRSIKLGRDFGSTVEVLSGLEATDHVIMNPPDGIAEGMTVQVARPANTNLTNLVAK